MKKLFLYLFASFFAFGFVSCKNEGERKIEYVKPVDEHNRPVDSLMMEMDGLMQQYQALYSRGENGEEVMTEMRAVQARMQDFGLKMEAVMHDMSEEDVDRFMKFYDECLQRMGVSVEPSDSFDVAF